MMSRSVKAYSNGFLGIGGSSSSSSKINEFFRKADLKNSGNAFSVFISDEYAGYEGAWKKISSLVGETVESAGDFFSLSAEQMLSVKENLPYLYEKIKQLADDGYKDASQYMDAYTEYAKQRIELEEAYQEKLTGITFDSLKSDFRNALTDMDSDAEDFADNFEKYMREAIIEGVMTSLYDDRLKSWYEKFASYMESGGTIDDVERKELKSEYDAIVSDALASRQELEDMGLINADSDSSSSQSSSYGNSTSMSQDAGEEINGRLTAMQWSGEQRLAIQNTISQNVASLVTLQTAENSFLSEIRTMMFSSTNYLADIQADTRKIYNEWTGKLDKMQKSLEKL